MPRCNDVSVVDREDEYRWLAASASRFGFANPSWARPVELGGTGACEWAGGTVAT